MANEGTQTVRLLERDGWTVEHNNNTGWYTAHRRGTVRKIRFKSGVRTQRILDELAKANGARPVRTTSGTARKDRQARQREHNKRIERPLTTDEAWAKAVREAQLTEVAEQQRHQKTTLVTRKVADYFAKLSLTTTFSAITSAKKHGITGRQIQTALVHPLAIIEGYNECVIYVGTDCKVVVSSLGYIVAVNPVE